MNKIMQNTVLGLLILMAIGFVVVVAQRDLVVDENKEFQKEIVELKHKDNENYVEVMKQFNVALDYITEELNKRDLSFDKAKQLVGVKYGSRAWLGANGYKPKDKGLEKQLCIEVYDA